MRVPGTGVDSAWTFTEQVRGRRCVFTFRHAAARRAMECAATVIAHRCVARRRRAALDSRLSAVEIAGRIAGTMREMLAESDRERQRP